jgi:hypothetical protein
MSQCIFGYQSHQTIFLHTLQNEVAAVAVVIGTHKTLRYQIATEVQQNVTSHQHTNINTQLYS